MRIYNSPAEIKLKEKTYLLKINEEESQVLIEALTMFDAMPVKYKPKTKELKTAIKEIKTALTHRKTTESSIISNPNENCVGDVCEV